MPNPNEVACSFIPAFFERLASGPSELASMYAPQSSLVVVDSDCGTTEASGADVVPTILNLATIFNGREWCVERFSAASLYSGVCIHTSLAVESATARHYFHFVTVLEEIPARDYEPPSYYIRHQTIIRQGAVEKEQPSEKKVDDVEARLADHQRSEDGPASTNAQRSHGPVLRGWLRGELPLLSARVLRMVTQSRSHGPPWPVPH
ncbi:hypothetical protein ERJ75_000734100 [Trypanosoma vivax]|nr:hypothetical protein ERJ75_000734100 [Trypanosoma vivax]